MKLRFEPDLDLSKQAVCERFRGQEFCRTEFTVIPTAVTSGSAQAELDPGVAGSITVQMEPLCNEAVPPPVVYIAPAHATPHSDH